MDKSAVDISVIVPLYNVERWVGECIRSLRAQSYADFEVIVVDDGSTDGSAAECRRAIGGDPRFRIVSRANGGLSAARNTGLEHCRGEYVAFVDSDDALHPRYLERLHQALEECDAEIAQCRITSGRTRATGRRGHRCDGRTAVAEMLYQKRGGFHSSACGSLIKRTLIADTRLFPEGMLYEDLAAMPGLFLGAQRVVRIPDRLYYYRITPGSILHKFTLRRLDVLTITAGYEERFSTDRLLRGAARSRRLSATFNMLGLLLKNMPEEEALIEGCRRFIQKRAVEAIFDARVRFKNKIGSLLTLACRSASERVLLRFSK